MAKKILIVDDEPDILKIVTYRLGKAGYEIIAAADGQKGLDLIKEQKPDLVLLDLRLPVLDGDEVCKQVKADDKLKDIPVILLTATSSVNKIADFCKISDCRDFFANFFSCMPKQSAIKVNIFNAS